MGVAAEPAATTTRFSVAAVHAEQFPLKPILVHTDSERQLVRHTAHKLKIPKNLKKIEGLYFCMVFPAGPNKVRDLK